jgi:integrase/recombinase XerD
MQNFGGAYGPGSCAHADHDPTSPLLKERLKYLDYLTQQQMSVRALKECAIYMLIVIEFLRLDTRKDKFISIAKIQKAANRWANRKPKPRNLKDLANAKRRFIKYATRWIKFIGKLSPIIIKNRPYEIFLEEYKKFMTIDCEFSSKTIDVNYRMIHDFLHRLYK